MYYIVPGRIIGDAWREQYLLLCGSRCVILINPILIIQQVGDDRVLLHLLLEQFRGGAHLLRQCLLPFGLSGFLHA